MCVMVHIGGRWLSGFDWGFRVVVWACLAIGMLLGCCTWHAYVCAGWGCAGWKFILDSEVMGGVDKLGLLQELVYRWQIVEEEAGDLD